jgi:hypothetical protein
VKAIASRFDLNVGTTNVALLSYDSNCNGSLDRLDRYSQDYFQMMVNDIPPSINDENKLERYVRKAEQVTFLIFSCTCMLNDILYKNPNRKGVPTSVFFITDQVE